LTVAGIDLCAKHFIVLSAMVVVCSFILFARTVEDFSQSLVRNAVLRDATAYSKTLSDWRSSEVIAGLQRLDVKAARDYREHPGEIPLPATLSQLVGERYDEQSAPYKTRWFSDHPFPGQEHHEPMDAFERFALIALRQKPTEPFHRFENIDGQMTLRFATADRLEASCVELANSHPKSSKNDWKAGDVRGVLAIQVPLAAAIARTNAEARGPFALLAVIGGGLALLLGLALCRLHRQAGRLAKADKQIAGDAILLARAKDEINTAQSDLQASAVALQRSGRAALNLSRDMCSARDAAEAAAYAKTQFLAIMSHEIRTPMTAILGFSEALDELVTDDECRETVATIRRNGEHLLFLINDILDLSKIEAGKFSVEHIRCSPRDLLLEVRDLMQVRADQKGLQWEVENNGPLPQSIRSDPARLKQILINLVGNAIKFTESGSVRLVAEMKSHSGEAAIEFRVIDTGIGITSEQSRQLFQPFVQADSSMARRYGGTGLGLTISKRLAELLGGAIGVQSSPGSGSTFIARVATGPLDSIPLIEQIESGDSSAERLIRRDAMTREDQLKGVNVLVVEDGVDNQRLVRWVLAKAGASVEVEGNGELGGRLALAAQERGEPFDVILMDMQMPILDGYAATRLLRGAGCESAIIALTAHAMAEDRQKCLDAGCDGFATKPFRRHELVRVVAEFARESRVETV
jgi:signal transduction histidine kinase